MKTIPSQVLIILFLILLTGCSSKNNPDQSPVLLATTSIVGDIVQAVAGDQFQVDVLLPREVGPHGFQPHPGDLARLSESDVLFINGAGLELFLEEMLASTQYSGQVVDLSENVPLLRMQTVHETDHGHHHHHDIDPHVLLDPNMVVFWLRPIAEQLMRLDPQHKTVYQTNAQHMHSELLALDEWIRQEVERIPDHRRRIVADHRVFGYFARRYQFDDMNAILPGFSSLAEPSAKELADLQEDIKKHGVPALVVGIGSDLVLAGQLAEDLDLDLVKVYTGGLGPEGGPAGTYLGYMKTNISRLADALGQ